MNPRRRWNLAIPSVLVLMSLATSAAGQKAKLSSTALHFGHQGVGVPSAAASVVLSNTDSTEPLTIAGVAAGGDFSETDNCNGSVAPSSSCTLLVTFAPTATGTQTGVLSISDTASNSPQLITADGTGVAVLAASPSSLAFGTVAVGSTSSAKTVTLTNNLKETATVGISTSGDYAVAGSGTSPCPTFGGLAASASCTVSVTFKPTFNGAVSGALTIDPNPGPVPQIVSLSGSGSGGSAPLLTFSPTSLSFPSTPVAVSNSMLLTVTNSGTKAMTISGFSASGDFEALGGTNSPCGGVLAASKSCTIAVNFTPTAAASVSGALTITTNGSVKTQVVNLTGKGIRPVSASPSSLTFASQQQGIASAAQIVTLTNHLTTTLSISAITLSGDYARQTEMFDVDDCASSLAPSATCTIAVEFYPLGLTGTINGTLTIESNAGLSPLVIPLSGTAQGSLPRWAYVANIVDNTVSEYTVDAGTGQLRHNGYVQTGNEPTSVLMHPSNKFVYVANFMDHTISEFSIGGAGGLKGIGLVSTGSRPSALAVVPSGKFLYVINDIDDTVSGYTVNTGSGVLTTLAGSTLPTGSEPVALTISPSGKFAYISNTLDNTVSAYTINSSTGILTAVKGSPFPTGQGPNAITITPSGRTAYILNITDNTVSAYKINTSTGALTAIASYPTDVLPVRAAIDHSGQFLYVLNSTGGDISAYTIDSGTGELTVILGSPFLDAGKFPSAVVIDPTNQFLYSVDQGSNQVSSYSINPSTGALRSLAIVEARSTPFAIAMSSGAAPVTYTPRFVVLTRSNQSNTVAGFTIAPSTGALTPVPGSPLPTGVNPSGIAFDPTGRFVYVDNAPDEINPGSVSAYKINATSGAFSEITGSPFTAGILPFSVATDPSGRFIYAANFRSGSISAYAINPSSGALTPIPGSPFSQAPASGTRCMAVDPSGRFLYTGNEGASVVNPTLSGFAIDPSTGALTQVPGSPLASLEVVESMAIDPMGRYVYAVSQSGVSSYSIDFSTGALTAIFGGTATYAGLQPTSVTVHPSGQFVYVSDEYSSSVYAYEVLSDGELRPYLSGSAFDSTFGPVSVGADPSGRLLYAAEDNNGITGYSVNPSNGALTSPASIVVPGAFALAVSGKIH